METLKEVLMRRDGNTEEEAEDRIQKAVDELEELLEGDETPSILEAEDVVKDHFGLEPDYLEELLARVSHGA